MDLLGIGPLEIILILILVLLVMGPKDMQKSGRILGRALNKIINSEMWKGMRQLSDLPNKLVREARVEELMELNKEIKSIGNITPPPVAQGRESIPSDTVTPHGDNLDYSAWIGQPEDPSPPTPGSPERTE